MPFDAAPIANTTSDCLQCPVWNCIGRRGYESTVSAWADMLGPRMAVMPGAPPLFSTGEERRGLYLVRAGCLKTFSIDSGGHEHIRRFHLPGDVLGLDALGTQFMQSTATAVTPSQVCIAPLASLQRLQLQQPEIAQHLMEQISRELTMALTMSGDYTAEQRVAAFLLHMDERLRSMTGLLRLPMLQRDVGNYLRLAPETVCRTIKIFASRGWIRCEAKGMRLLGSQGMFELAESVGICRPAAASLAA